MQGQFRKSFEALIKIVGCGWGGRDATGRRLSDAPNLGPRIGAPGNFKHYAYQRVHLAV